MHENIKLTEEEISTNSRLKEINETMAKLINLCKVDPQASIICSISIPSVNPDADGAIISIYHGETATQINQLNLLADTNPDFYRDLSLFLEYRVRTQMKKTGSTGNNLTDQMLSSLDKNETKH